MEGNAEKGISHFSEGDAFPTIFLCAYFIQLDFALRLRIQRSSVNVRACTDTNTSGVCYAFKNIH